MKLDNRESLLFGVGLGLLIAILVGGGVYGISHFLRRPASAASITQPEQTSTTASSTQIQYGGTEPGSTVQLSNAEQEAAGVQTSEVRRRQLITAVSAFGRVEEPESRLSTISARVGGRLDKLYLQYTGQNVQQGQPIAEIYSPELLSASEEYKLALDSRSQLQPGAEPEAIRAADDLVSASRRRLELWGVTGQQIGQIAAGQINPDVTVYATTSGTVVERKATQGQYVNAGDMLYSISDLSTVWVKADVYESDLPQIRAGQPVTITSDALPGETIHGSVEFVEPQASVETRTVPVHIHVANPGMQLRPGMFVRAVFAVHQQNALAIQRSAVLDTGTRKLVYVARGNAMFEAREVQTGAPDNDWYPVLSGLRGGEEVVINGNFLIDSQTRLTSGMTGLFGGSREFTGREGPGGANAEAARNNAKLTYRTDPDPLKGGAPAKFYVQLTDAAGKAISDAKVSVTLVMPAMPSMNMPEMRAAGDLAWNGKEYSGTINVPMAGPWSTTFEATRNGQILASQHARLSAR
jgi:multidrug efflux pump subunit AcrA (membrane-fusion protein)